MATIFKRTQLGLYQTVGEQLRTARMQLGYSLETCAEKLGVQIRYLRAIEDSHYASLPGDLYTRSWIRKYATHLGLKPEHIMISYEKERLIQSKLTPPAAAAHRSSSRIWEFLTLRRITILMLVLSLVGYASYLTYATIRPPRVLLNVPLQGFRTNGNSIIIKGQTEPETAVYINGEQITVSTTHLFEQEVILREGLNTIRIEVKKKRGRTFTRELPIIYAPVTTSETGS